MGKFTVVYSEYENVGSNRFCFVRTVVVEGTTLKEAIESSEIEWSQINFVFEGECKQYSGN